MTTSLTDAAIVPITLTVNGRIGLTLYAPPWEDEDGEEWQGFLGDGAKILLYPGVTRARRRSSPRARRTTCPTTRRGATCRS